MRMTRSIVPRGTEMSDSDDCVIVSSPKRKKLSETVHIDLLSDSDVSDSDSDGKFPAVVLKQEFIPVADDV